MGQFLSKSDIIRHDPCKIAQVIINIVNRHRTVRHIMANLNILKRNKVVERIFMFSETTKSELVRVQSQDPCCGLAEILGIIRTKGIVRLSTEDGCLYVFQLKVRHCP